MNKKGDIFLFPKKNDLGIIKNYNIISLTAIGAQVLFNYIKPENEKILRKNQNGFHGNWCTTSRILRIPRNEATRLVVDFSKALDSISRGKMEQMQQAYYFLKETFTALKML